MLEPLRQWFCDECGEVIESPDDGVLEKIKGKDGLLYDLKIVHHKDECQHHRDELHLMTTELNAITGVNGLAYLLFLIDPDLAANPKPLPSQVKDPRECAEIFRRLLIPHYEEARRYMLRAKNKGLIHSLSGLVIGDEETLKEIITEYRD